MVLSRLTLTHVLFLLCAIILVAAAPSASTDKYQYKVAKKDEILARGSRTRPHQRRASQLPGQANYAVFENTQLGGLGAGPQSVSDTIQPTFDACGILCTRTPGCEFFRWTQTGGRQCALRTGQVNRIPNDPMYRSAIKGITCAMAKALYSNLASSTCVEEFH